MLGSASKKQKGMSFRKGNFMASLEQNGKDEINTAASFISYVSKVEKETSDFYKTWAIKHDELEELFLSIAKENEKNEKTLRRAYYGVVSDALETNFCFKGLSPNISLPSLSEKSSAFDVLKASIALETSIADFYTKAAEISKALLADVPRTLGRVARHRRMRVERLSAFRENHN